MLLPPLKSLPIFEAVARLNSFSKAADELNLSQSAISHQIKLLENYLGESLFIRQGKKLTMTDEGRSYLSSISSSLEVISHASNQIKGAEKTSIRLAVYSSFAVSWLIPHLNDFKKLYPQIDLSIEMTHSTPELSDRTADCFITVDKVKRGFSADLMYEERLFPVCSPTFFTQIQADLGIQDLFQISECILENPSILAKYSLITHSSIYDKYLEDWRVWFAEQNILLPESIKFQKFSHLLLAYEAAKHHQGIALINDFVFKYQTPKNSLIALPTHFVKTSDQFNFVYKTSRRNEHGISQLKQWITRQSKSLVFDPNTN